MKRNVMVSLVSMLVFGICRRFEAHAESLQARSSFVGIREAGIPPHCDQLILVM